MNWSGILVGIASFLIIGVLHPVVIKVEYRWGKRVWPVFLVLGIACNGLSLLIRRTELSILLAILGFSLFWSIRELFQQEKRVEKGWFPSGPAHKKH